MARSRGVPLTAHREEEGDGAAIVAVAVPQGRMPQDDDRKLGSLRPIVAGTIAAFLADITRLRPWSMREGAGVRPVRSGDVALLVRKTTPEFLGPVEQALLAQGVPYRIVGGKELRHCAWCAMAG